MKNNTFLKHMLKPILLITISVILFIDRNKVLGAVVFLIYLVDNFYQLNCFWKNENDFQRFIDNINEGISKNILQFIYPLVVIKSDGTIVWSNNVFNLLKQKDDIKEENILSIARGLNLDELINCEDNLHQRLEMKNKLYDVYLTVVPIKEEKLYLLSFNDITKLIDYETTQESIMLIEVDNYSEALDNTLENERPLLVAEIETYINLYANNLNAMIRKYDTNKYVLSVQDKYIEDEISQKFKIIDEISKIDKGNKLKVTLSIGVGRGAMSPQENYNNAKIAKELALGRGGDQVAVKSKKDIKFFGGNTKELEKRTKVKARVIARALSELIYESKKIYILGHKNPDMDCFGASVGLANVIKQMGKNCSIILNDDTNAIEYYLNKLSEEKKYEGIFKSSEEAKSELDNNTLVIVLDVHNKGYVSDLALVEKAERKVIIDHHRRSPDMIEHDILNYIEVYASSTSEMITEIIQYMVEKPNLGTIEAEGLLAGIYMDTKGFSFKTGVRTFEAASFLKALGADMIEIKKMFTDDLDQYLQIASTIKFVEVNDKVAIAIAPKDITDTVVIAKAADELLNISGINASFVIGEINNEVYISGRSVGDINVQVVLESLGGGGHMNIAGAKLDNISTEETKNKLKEAVQKYVRIGE